MYEKNMEGSLNSFPIAKVEQSKLGVHPSQLTAYIYLQQNFNQIVILCIISQGALSQEFIVESYNLGRTNILLALYQG